MFVAQVITSSYFHQIGPLGRFDLVVAMSVCLMSLFMWYILRPHLPPLPEVRRSKILEIRNPWGKVLERSGLRIEHFVGMWSKIAAQKKVEFLLILPYKTWWKPRFPME